MRRRNLAFAGWTVLAAAIAVTTAMGPVRAADQVVPVVKLGPIRWALPAETPEQAAARHALVAERRAKLPVMAHRGSAYVAPEDTLGAFTATIDVGGDGWEFDIHRTRDNVLVVNHDDAIDRMADGHGVIEDMYYEELMLYPFKGEAVGAPRRVWVPTLVEFLEMARQCGGLFNIDIKNPAKGLGIDAEVADLLTQADMWDQVVGGSSYWPAFRNNPRIVPIRHSAWMIFDSHEATNAEDADIRTVRAELARKPGMVVSDDPRLVLEALGRPIGAVKPQEPQVPTAVDRPPLETLMAALFGFPHWPYPMAGRLAGARLVNYYGDTAAAEIAAAFRPNLPHEARVNIAWTLGMIGRWRPAAVTPAAHEVLVALARDREADVRAEAAYALGFAGNRGDVKLLVGLATAGHDDARRLTPVVADNAARVALENLRAAAAESLGRIGDARPEVVSALTALVAKPSVVTYRASDAVAAAGALARLEAKAGLDTLRATAVQDSKELRDGNPWLTEQNLIELYRADSAARGAACKALATIGGPPEMALLVSLATTWPTNARPNEEEEGTMALRREMTPAIDALAMRGDRLGFEACARILFSPLGKMRREAFFMLWGAEKADLVADAVARELAARLEAGQDLTGCSMAAHLLGYLGQHSVAIEQALAKAAASSDEAVRERAAWASARLGGS